MSESASAVLGDVTVTGRNKIERWQRAVQRLDSAKRDVNSAECELENAMNDLGRWILPEDADVGEKIAIWFGDSLIQCEKTDHSGIGTYRLTIRTRGQRPSLRRPEPEFR